MYLSSFGPAVHVVNSLLWSYCIRDQILLFVSPVYLPEVVCKSVKKKVVQTGTDVECLLKVYKGSLRKDWS